MRDRPKMNRLERWLMNQMEVSDFRFWVVAIGYTAFLLLICCAIASGLSLLLDGTAF